jgi:hypothetical protein
MTEKTFTDGLIVKRAENAPDFVLCNISIKVEDFTKWMQDHQDKGWVNISLLVGKSGKPYGVKDTYKPKEETQKEPLMNNDLPF